MTLETGAVTGGAGILAGDSQTVKMNARTRIPGRVRGGDPVGLTAVPVSEPEPIRAPADEAEVLSSLIARIYDASLDPTVWPEALGGVSGFAPGLSTALFSKDMRQVSGGIYFDDGYFSPEEKQLYFSTYIKIDPFNGAHVFAEIGKAIELKTTEAATFADTLDGIAAGMLLLDAKGNVTHANATGRAMLADGDVLREKNGRAVAYDTQANQALAEILASSGSDEAIGIKGVSLPITGRSDERYVAHILPLTSGARRRAGANYSAVAAMFVRKAALDTRSPLEIVAKAYGLTPSELRVLLAVAEGGGVAEVSDALGIAETTVKFHLRSLFEKTGTHRQAELVKLIAGYSGLPAS